jgi:hypothetical protein
VLTNNGVHRLGQQIAALGARALCKPCADKTLRTLCTVLKVGAAVEVFCKSIHVCMHQTVAIDCTWLLRWDGGLGLDD